MQCVSVFTLLMGNCMAGATHCPQLHCDPAQFQLPICIENSRRAIRSAPGRTLALAAFVGGNGICHLGAALGRGAGELAVAFRQVGHPSHTLLKEPRGAAAKGGMEAATG